MLERWYDCVIADGKTSNSRIVAARGSHVGEAIARAEQKAGRVVAVAAGEAPIGESVGKAVVERNAGPALDGALATARWPRGVIPSWKPDGALRAPQSGYVVHETGPTVVVEATCASDSAHDLWLTLVEQMPVIDNIEVRLLPAYTDGAEPLPHTDVWLTPRINGKKAVRFLDDHQNDLSNNGLLEVAAYQRNNRSTMRLTEHKTIVWVSETATTVADIEKWLAVAKVPRAESMAALGDVSAAPHWHYRLDAASDRARMEKRLHAMRLKRVDRIVTQ